MTKSWMVVLIAVLNANTVLADQIEVGGVIIPISYHSSFPTAQYPYAQAPNGCSGYWGTSEFVILTPEGSVLSRRATRTTGAITRSGVTRTPVTNSS